jgi:hypothetical protein
MKHMDNSSRKIMIYIESKSQKVISPKRQKSKKVQLQLDNRECMASSICSLIWVKFLIQFKDIDPLKISKLEANQLKTVFNESKWKNHLKNNKLTRKLNKRVRILKMKSWLHLKLLAKISKNQLPSQLFLKRIIQALKDLRRIWASLLKMLGN